ncbi:hypothetical protein PSTEL_22795 [Paenibacillus stellifer]|uniref:HAMP domain-containing protein n=1 Tax=Paenibacillus stellifer TaxID=169760 RepID=A0A089M215_9BACL|nr:sensor histidine kinase [Paenibacillus stellifer]AIQ65523.1 hypothetical protein PSTEL_22795 [Paenibacillus stellifer]
MLRNMTISKSFTAKIIVVLLLVILIPTIFTSLSFYWVSDAILKKNVRESTLQIAEQTADSLSFILNVGIDTSDFISSDPNIQRAAMQVNADPSYEDNWNFQYINLLLNNYVYSNSFVKIVYLLKEEGKGWGSGTFSDSELMQIRLSDEEWVKEVKRKDGELVWQGLQYDHFSGGGENTDLVLPVGRLLKDFDTLNNIGLVQVNLDGQSILDTIRKLKLGNTGKFFVADSEGRIMIDSNIEMINKRVRNPDLYRSIVDNDRVEFEFEMEGIPYYGVKQPLSNGWMVVGTVPVNEISGQLERLQTQILLTSAIFSILAVGIGLFVARTVTKPVKQLTQSMLRVQQGNLETRTDIRTSDEIGFLSKQFNKMVHEIGKLMQQVENEQNEKHYAELRAVMHRIQPHFLFNTLSTLRWLIDSGQKDRASEVLSALNHLLEANMGKNGVMITVDQELNIIRKYLILLELRYEKHFHLELDVQPGTGEIIIPRMLLQPLVENAIFHGIVPKNTDGRITITIRNRGEGLEIRVQDDGRGFEEDKLGLLNKAKNGAEEGEIGIGLRHIFDSLRLYYDNDWECSFESSPGQGTIVRIVLKQAKETTSWN